jgi:broad specificity phosphatase PhoE
MGAIYLLRHGQASFGGDNYDQLSPTGVAQARVLGQALKARGVLPDAVLSGTMQRHRDTASECLAELSATLPVREHAGVNEFDHEAVIRAAEPRYANRLAMMTDFAATGDPRRAFQAFFKGAVARWVSGAHDADYAEPWAAFRQRCVAALDDVVQATPAKGTTLVFTSGGFISVACAHLLGLSDAQAFTINWTLINAGITKLVAGRDGVHLVSLNEHAHLEGATPALLTYR